MTHPVSVLLLPALLDDQDESLDPVEWIDDELETEPRLEVESPNALLDINNASKLPPL